MSTVVIPTFLRRAIRDNQWFRNGTYPASGSHRWIAEDMNHLLYMRPKCVGSWRCPIQSTPASANGSSRTRWRAAYHASSFAKELIVGFECMRAGTDGGAESDPYAKLLVETSDGTDIGTVEFHTTLNPGTSSTIHTTDKWSTGFLPLRSAGVVVTLTPNTDYYLTFSDEDGARIVSATVFERPLAADTDNGYLDSGAIVSGGPILDEHVGDIVTLARTAWKRNRRQLFNWSANTDALAPQTSSATPVNLLDESLSANTGASPGYKLFLSRCSTVRRTTVPVKMWVYGSASSNNGHVHLEASDGTDYLDLEIDSATPQWYTVTGDLPATDDKYDIFFYGDGANTFTVNAVCLGLFET